MIAFKRDMKGAIGGFLFGTFGIFLLAVVSLVSPIIEVVSMPFLFPGRQLAALLGGSSASTGLVFVLYLATGIFYAIVGVIIEEVVRMLRRSSTAAANAEKSRTPQ